MKYLSVLALPFVLFASFEMDAEPKSQAPMGENLRTAIFAGGCSGVWSRPTMNCQGIVSTISGYAGGHQPLSNLSRCHKRTLRSFGSH